MPRGKAVTTSIYFNKYKPQKDGKCPVSIRVTFLGEKRYYDSGYRMLLTEFEALFQQKLRSEQKRVKLALDAFESKALSCIEKLSTAFTFAGFERMFLTNRASADILYSAFSNYIDDIEEDRVGTMLSYGNARDSFEKFKPKSRVADVSPRFLHEYEAWMLGNKRSITTVGIYCRCLRSVMNSLISAGQISRELYPFGSTKNKKYEIPLSKSKKKSLTLNEISLIYNHHCEPGSSRERSRDFWMFLYFANGINIKDFCLLRWKDFNGNRITFLRQKTVRTKREVEPIEVIVIPEMKVIIEKWGNLDKDPAAFIFPCVSQGLTPFEIKRAVDQVGKVINEHIDAIAKAEGIEKLVRTSKARKSFATIMKNSGAPVALISQAMGHGSISTTEAYFASFEDDQLNKAIAALTAFK